MGCVVGWFQSAGAAWCLALSIGGAIAQSMQDPGVAIGAKVDAQFTDVHWQKRRLPDFGADKRAFVVYFATVECPIVRRSLPVLGGMAQDYLAHDVVTIVMNVGAGDAFVDAAAQATEHAPRAYFGKDCDLRFARACGVERTNTVVVLDGEQRLRYRGRIDDQHSYATSRERALHADLRAALDDVLAGRKVAVAETEPSGCRLAPLPAPDPTHVPTYGREVWPIFERTCLHCHRRDPAGGVALATDADRKKHAAMIAEVVGNGRMPPWLAATTPRTLIDRSLSLAERETVRAWIGAGMPIGEGRNTLAHATELPWRVGEVPCVIEAPAAIKVPATGTVPYEYCVLPYEFTVDTWVDAIDVRSQHPRALHHCNLAIVPKGSEFSPGCIVANFTPHGAPFQMAPGTALRIPAGSVMALQSYYSPIGRALSDRVQVGLRFPLHPVSQELRVTAFGSNAFEIPPNAASHRVETHCVVPADAEGISVFVHMHARGRDVVLIAEPPGGPPETVLVIPSFDFGSQETYVWAAGKSSFTKGTTIRAVAHFDNSSWNPMNPDPTCVVRPGPAVSDEQLQVVLTWRAKGEDLGLVVDGRTGRCEPALEHPGKGR